MIFSSDIFQESTVRNMKVFLLLKKEDRSEEVVCGVKMRTKV